MENISILLPEIFLSLAIFVTLLIGVFFKDSYNLVTKIIYAIIVFLILIIFNSFAESFNLFSNSYVSNSYTNFFKILILISALFTLIITQAYIKEKNINYFEYSLVLLLSILGMFIMISSNDLILFYLGLELQSLSLYILAALDRDNLKSNESGLKYFVLSALASGLLLYGCSLLYGFTGSTNFEQINLNAGLENTGAIFAMVFILVGLAFKVSAVPFHMWTPDVYEGSPTSVTAFFALAPKVAGMAAIIRILYVPFGNIVIEWQTILIFISVASMILGAVAAIGQSNIKRLMAYSGISHMGYALAGLVTGTKDGVASTILYVLIYVVMSIGSFVCILVMKRKNIYLENIRDLSGLSKNHPLVALSFVVILFSLAGIPPLAGFFAKFYIFMAVVKVEFYTLAVIGLVTSVISAFYYLRIIKIIYFDPSQEKFDPINSNGIKISLGFSTLVILFYFLNPSIFTFFTNIATAAIK